jgi:ATP-binding cassette subfamily B protein
MNKLTTLTSKIFDTLQITARVYGYFFKEFKFLSLISLALVAILAILPFFDSKTLELLVNNIATRQSSEELVIVVVLIVIAYTFPSIIYAIKGYFDKQVFIKLHEYWVLRLVKKRTEIDLATFENSDFKTLEVKVRDRGVYPVLNITDRTQFIFQNVIEIVIAALVTTSFNWMYLVAILCGALPKFIVETVYGKSVWGIWDAEADVRKRFWDIHDELNRPSIVDIKLYGLSSFFYNWLKKIHTEFSVKQLTGERRAMFLRLLSHVPSIVAYAWIIFELVGEVRSGTLLVGSIIFAFGSIRIFENAVSGLLGQFAKQYQDVLFAKDIFAFLETKSQIQSTGKELQQEVEPPRVEFKNVSYVYPGKTEPTLRDVSFTIEPGQKIAFVGNNGAGKTTIVKLLLRVYDPTGGVILVNGIPLSEISPVSWHKQLGVLLQDYTIFNIPVGEGIALGNIESPLNIAKVEDSARASEAHSFIEEWSAKYAQTIGRDFDGVEPSKGQKQKLAVARLWYREPRLMILDEPTSAVDAESEAKIFERIETLPKSVSAVLISHRFSTVRKADCIYVIENGSIREKGTHAELIAADGRYAELFNLQKKGYMQD